MSLQADVFACHDCDAKRFGFERSPEGGGFLKFPATIGSAVNYHHGNGVVWKGRAYGGGAP